MSRLLTALALLVPAALLAAPAGAAKDRLPDAGDAARANNAFAADLYGALCARPGNLFFSPYSISTALAMTRRGTRGETAAQMDRVFHWGDGTSSMPSASHRLLREALAPPEVKDGYGPGAKKVRAYEMHVANAVWVQQGLGVSGPFVKVLEHQFGAPPSRIDFRKTEKARAAINAWVAEHTRDRIRDIVPEGLPTPDTLLALANAIWFKAAWDHPFEARWTKEAPFTPSDGKEVKAPFMHRVGDFRLAETDEAQILEIDYRRGKTSMVVVLPKKKDGLAAVEAKLTPARLSGWLSALRPATVSVKLPRFTITCPTDLTAVLPGMGMPDAFDAKKADFSRITTEQPLMIGAVLHKAFVKVDEAGTEAAAATVVMMEKGCMPPKPVTFVADHPFLFLIRHRPTGCILFLGRLERP